MGNKKLRFSVVEKKTLRTLIVFVVIQLVIIFVFVRLFRSSQQINIEDVKQIDITVDDTYRFWTRHDSWLIVLSDSTDYLFASPPTDEESSLHEIYKSIHKGDKLSLMYQEIYNFLGKTNLVVDARSETQTFRTFEAYNKGKEGLPLFVIILSSVIEIAFIGIVFVSVWLDRNILKGIYRKIKRHSLRN